MNRAVGFASFVLLVGSWREGGTQAAPTPAEGVLRRSGRQAAQPRFRDRHSQGLDRDGRRFAGQPIKGDTVSARRNDMRPHRAILDWHL